MNKDKYNNKDIKSICILRFSALGDVTHMVPIIHSIQKFRPDITITWIIGTTEYKLVGDLPNVDFIQFNKKLGWKAYRDVLSQLKDKRFDVVLAPQVSMRANLLTFLLSAPRKIGYDRRRAKDFHGLVINESIPSKNIHVLDSFFQFIEQIGIAHKKLDWSLPIPKEAHQFAEQHLPLDTPLLAISPCSSHSLRNWNSQGYAEVANYANQKYNMKTVLLGGPSELEIQYGAEIAQRLNHSPINLIGKDTLKRLLAVLDRCNILLTPDSGPAHMATCVDTPVIGLHAASNSLRSGPYLSLANCVDKYSQAAQIYFGKPADQINWGTKIEKPGVMDLINSNEVIIKLDSMMEILKE
ncbi:MAG: glycosyltransferase family 9 protein [Pseudomonadota bacterium]